MSFLSNLRKRFDSKRVTLQLDDIQGLILRSRPEPYVGIHAMLHVDDAAGGRDLIGRLAGHVPSAEGWTDDMPAWMGVALSHAGLKALGLPDDSLKSFPLAFQQGMAARAAQLRDEGENEPETWEEAYQNESCHIALSIFAQSDAELQRVKANAMAELEQATGVRLMGTHEFGADKEAKNPFGYRDSISQPTVAGAGVEPNPGDERAIAAGEFILGEDSEAGSPVAMPSPDVLGRNGSFVVLRKYESRVGAFNDFLREHGSDEEAQDRLGAKMFGRWRSGAPLNMSPDQDDEALGADHDKNNDFDYSDDTKGLICPHSAHMRRMNPRGSKLTILTDQNIHRIIRRSSTFGPKWSRDMTTSDDTGDRGLFFIFISARAFDTIEFLQQEWINRGNFLDLGEERDPVVGLHEQPGRFTIPDQPVRRRVNGVTTFNRLRGGEYMFMPSISALKWIGEGSWLRG